MCVDLAFTGSLNRQEDHIFEFIYHGGLNAIRLRRRHATERLQRQDHVAEAMNRVVDILADLEMALSASRKLVVERMRHLGQFGLWNQMMGDASKMLDRAMVKEIPHLLAHADSHQFLSQTKVVSEMFLNLPPLRIAMWAIRRPLSFRMCLRLVHQIGDPGCDWFHRYLCALAFQEFEHVEIAIAFGDLGPEFAGYLHYRFHLSTIDFNRVHPFAGMVKSV